MTNEKKEVAILIIELSKKRKMTPFKGAGAGGSEVHFQFSKLSLIEDNVSYQEMISE